MTGRERTLRALSFQDVDRAPVAGGLLQNAEFLAETAGREDFWAAPRECLFEAFRRLGADAILGPVMPKRPECVTRDAEGRPTDFTVREAKPELTTPEQVAEHARGVSTPRDVRAGFDFQKAYDDYLRVSKAAQEECPDMLVIPHTLGYAPGFPTSDGYFKYEAFLMACALYPDDMERLFTNWGEASRCRFEATARAIEEHALPRFIWIGQDICDSRGPMLSPALFERLYFPQVARAIEPLKRMGVRVVWHMDANYRQILPQLIALGIDGFQGFYETDDGIRIEDLAGMNAASGDPLILFGSVATAWVLPHGNPDDVKREVERCLDARAGVGGLLLAPSSSIGPEVAPENIRAMYEHAVSSAGCHFPAGRIRYPIAGTDTFADRG